MTGGPGDPADEPTADSDLVADYGSAGFGNRLPLGSRPALVVIDMVRAYFEPGAELHLGDDSCLKAAADLLDAARQAGIPVVHTKVSFSGGGADGGVFFRKVGALKHFVGDGPLGQIMPEVAPREDEVVVVKQYASAFFGTSLVATLTAAHVDTLIVAGVSTSGCVRATAVDAIQHGFVPVVVREAVGDRDARPHEANLFDLQAKYAEVLPAADVHDYLATLGEQR
ncbi:isochorismatase family protein [Jatrophihabitans sp. YIM 134969]